MESPEVAWNTTIDETSDGLVITSIIFSHFLHIDSDEKIESLYNQSIAPYDWKSFSINIAPTINTSFKLRFVWHPRDSFPSDLHIAMWNKDTRLPI